MINIEDLFISQPALCAIASIDEFRGRWQGRGGIDETLAARLKERALNESVRKTAITGSFWNRLSTTAAKPACLKLRSKNCISCCLPIL